VAKGGLQPNAIAHTMATQKWLYPTGFYTVVRRFSSKEERRRVVANVVDPTALPYPWLGLENHLNVFHIGREPLSEDLAHGLATYLNSTAVDQYFRQFNGHTQVNATDLRSMRYPDRATLVALGQWAKGRTLTQAQIDEKVNSFA
jgi:adenine-specific DNA-methyltransferase